METKEELYGLQMTHSPAADIIIIIYWKWKFWSKLPFLIYQIMPTHKYVQIYLQSHLDLIFMNTRTYLHSPTKAGGHCHMLMIIADEHTSARLYPTWFYLPPPGYLHIYIYICTLVLCRHTPTFHPSTRPSVYQSIHTHKRFSSFPFIVHVIRI